MTSSTVLKRRQRRQDYPIDFDVTLEPTAAALDNALNGAAINHVSSSRTASTVKNSNNNSHLTGSTTPFEQRRHKRVTRVFTHVLTAVVMTFVGWQSSHWYIYRKYPQLRSYETVVDPAWWLEDSVDDFFSRTYVQGLSALRKLNNSNYFTGMCGRYRFDTSLMPTISVIVTLQNEQPGMLSLTVHSILGRTPPELLTEIIIVDDNGKSDEVLRQLSVNQSEIDELQKTSPKIFFIHNTVREGVARSRMNGARAAKGEVLMFVDSHIEMLSATWAQHLLLPIMENPRTVAAQTLDIINDIDWSYGRGAGDLLYGVINDEFWFGYQRSRFGGADDKGREREQPSRRQAYETPFSAGSLFAVRRDRFFQVGGYDEGMYVWGGENTDFAIKTWACGGRLVMVPCSRVGHMYRIHIRNTGRWPPNLSPATIRAAHIDEPGDYFVHGNRADNFTRIISRNNIRVMERWARGSSARTGYYLRVFGNETLPEEWQRLADDMDHDPYAQHQRDVIRRLGCKDFRWFDKHVYVKLTGVHHPWHPSSINRRTWV